MLLNVPELSAVLKSGLKAYLIWKYLSSGYHHASDEKLQQNKLQIGFWLLSKMVFE